tara:strand:- start:1092 stop:1370 length:279 start_codon:yes stop_codon:yes gene_type:complete
MAYGLQVWNSSGTVMLDSNWRMIRFSAVYSGTVTYGTAVTITVSGLATDGTWGYNNTVEAAWSVKTTLGAGTIVIEALVSGTHNYQLLLFRI